MTVSNEYSTDDMFAAKLFTRKNIQHVLFKYIQHVSKLNVVINLLFLAKKLATTNSLSICILYGQVSYP